MNITDTNAAQCVVASNLNTSSNNTGVYSTTWNTTTYTSKTSYTIGQMDGSYDWADNNTGAYLWTYSCNDSAGNIVSLGENYTFYIDSTDPTAFIFNTSLWKTDNILLWNATTATDYTPQVGWTVTTELNFSKYEIYFYDTNYGNATYLNVNESTKTTLSINISTLAADTDYLILITAVDLAGNRRNMTTINYKYSTDSTNRALSAGWNIVGNVGNAMTLSAILNYTGATTVSIWNSTHEFQSHVSGGSYGTTSVGAGDTVLIYVAADTTFSDLIWNTTAVSEEAHNITNQTASTYNLVMMRDDDDDKLIGDLDKYLNCNPVGEGCSLGANNATYVDYFSAYNNSASAGSKYVSFVANWTTLSSSADVNMTDLSLGFGNTVWLYLDGTEKTYIQMNWTAIS